jgi:hypothetical protein
MNIYGPSELRVLTFFRLTAADHIGGRNKQNHTSLTRAPSCSIPHPYDHIPDLQVRQFTTNPVVYKHGKAQFAIIAYQSLSIPVSDGHDLDLGRRPDDLRLDLFVKTRSRSRIIRRPEGILAKA